jgi:hypothetical protein
MMADCRRFESASACSHTIIGEQDGVVRVAAMYAVADHGQPESPELGEQIRSRSSVPRATSLATANRSRSVAERQGLRGPTGPAWASWPHLVPP